MSIKGTDKTTWIVVEVNSGIPVDIKAFSNHDVATNYLESLRQSLNPDNDEAEIFKVDLPTD